MQLEKCVSHLPAASCVLYLVVLIEDTGESWDEKNVQLFVDDDELAVVEIRVEPVCGINRHAVVFILSYLKLSWASLPAENWEETKIELCSETSLYL